MKHAAGWAIMLAAVGLVAVTGASADVVPLPDYSAIFGGSGVGVGARALAMGGAATALSADGTALYWNPAALGRVSGIMVDTPVTAKTDGVNWRNEYDTIRAAIDEDELDIADFNILRDIATSGGGSSSGVDGTVAAMAGVAVGLGDLGGVGAGGYAEGEFQADVAYQDAGSSDTVSIDGSALYTYSAGAAIGRQVIPGLYVGLGLRQIWAGFSPANITYTRTGSEVDRGSDTSTTLRGEGLGVDVGVQYTPQKLTDFRFGLMARNINSPTIDFEDDMGGTASVDFDPCVNLGAAWQAAGLTVAGDLHNISEANNAGTTWHLGAELEVIPHILRVRAGLHDGTVTLGAAGMLGPVSLALATDAEFKESVGLQFGFSF
jgi:hypothetical protein